MQDRFDRCLDGLLPVDGGAVLLAVSGGIDSMVMADLFLNSSLHPSIALVHCNFHLRGEDSDADALLVQDWAESHGIPFRRADFDTVRYAGENGISIEMAARELRYSWFSEICGKEGFKAVAVAHNLGDNVETMFLNLLRGTGLKGICGMKASSPLQGSLSVRLIRPLLQFPREEIHEYALSRGIRWREDRTNSDSSYRRNLIRNEVFPLLEKVNPSFLKTLEADMRRFSQVQEIADDFVSNRLPDGTGGITIDVEELKRTPHWEYVLFRMMEPFGFNESVISDLADLVKGASTFSGRRFLSNEYVAETSRTSIIISGISGRRCSPRRPFSRTGREAQVGGGNTDAEGTEGSGNTDAEGADATEGKEGGECRVEGPGEYSLDGIRFVVDEVAVEDPRQPVGTTVGTFSFPFTVRHWQPGDWMRPLGMRSRRKKLSDMFVDLKFTAPMKREALVIADEGSHVLALIGWRIDESVAIVLSEQHPPRRPFSRTGREAQGDEGDVVPVLCEAQVGEGVAAPALRPLRQVLRQAQDGAQGPVGEHVEPQGPVIRIRII